MTNLTPIQIQALKCLADHGDMTYNMLYEEGINIPTGEMSKGTISASGTPGNPESLEARSLVKCQEMGEGEGRGKLWSITASGRRLADKLHVRERGVGEDHKIPNGMLEKAAKAVKATRHYGLELFTDEDLRAVRAKLTEAYHNVPLDSVRQQIINRRKQGAFADPTEKQRKAFERLVREFGPEGTVLVNLLTAKQLSTVREQLDILKTVSESA